MSKSAYIVFGRPDITDAEIAEVVDSMQSRWLGTGPKVKAFEEGFATYLSASPAQVAAVNSCSAALHLSMIASDINSGDEVITTAMTFCATVNAIIHAGGTPVLADIDPVTRNIDPVEIAARITKKTKAIIPVHYSGLPCDMTAITDIAEQYKLKVIEDCAHAIETRYQGQPAGSFGDFACYSFYVTKNMTTGEGGMVMAKSEQAIARIKTLALHGMSADAWTRFSDKGYRHYQVVEPGFKYNMMDLQAAIGIHQLERLEKNWQFRKELFQTYQSEFANLPADLPTDAAEGDRSSYHLYPLCIHPDACRFNRDQLLGEFHQAGIGTGVHYQSIAAHPYYQKAFGWVPEDYPMAKFYGDNTLSLPFGPGLQEDQIDKIITTTKKLFEH